VIKRPGMETFTFPGTWTDWLTSQRAQTIDISASHPGGIIERRAVTSHRKGIPWIRNQR